jgi:hypothetical protein
VPGSARSYDRCVPARRRLTALFVAAGFLAGCGGTSTPETTGTSTTTTRADPAAIADEGAPTPVPEALDWVAPDLRGGDVVGADLAGQDVVLWFWAPW